MDLRQNGELLNGFKLICPVQSHFKKYSASPLTQITSISPAVLSPRGAARDRHGRGTGCGGRWQHADERRLRRTEKSCGPDASTPASSLRP